ncbi:MAG: HAMP domain-containing histidine kinase [Saprospiraceae bacterium]|nr:HAMP domain-containing histidine kinase [Lewinella sp.]MCB0664436.1 HAMP domain-containing histidine kinase [Saprospiraceae bacterium]
MKLLNQSLLYSSVPLFVLVSIWAVFFYFSMFREIYDSIDDGLDNYKLLIIQKAKRDPLILQKRIFDESNYAIREIPPSHAVDIKDVYEDTLMYMLNEEEMEPVRMLTTAFQYDRHFFELKVISSMIEEDDQMTNLLRATIWLYVLLLLSITVINNVILHRLWRPFHKFLEQLKNFRIDKRNTIPAMSTNIQEFLELKNAANILIDHTLEAYRNQNQFISNAAHELQTPLAVITNKLELLLEEGRLTDADAETIGQVMQTITHLKQRYKSLLFLSKIENKQFFDNQPLSLNQLVEQVVAELEDYSAFKNVDLFIDEKEQVEVNMDPHLAHILVANLIKNAIFHNLENGEVRITLGGDSLMVNNTSQTGKLDEQKMFERFYRAAGNRKGTGLGLPIVQAICKLYRFTIAYSYEQEHSFVVTFQTTRHPGIFSGPGQ